MANTVLEPTLHSVQTKGLKLLYDWEQYAAYTISSRTLIVSRYNVVILSTQPLKLQP